MLLSGVPGRFGIIAAAAALAMAGCGRQEPARPPAEQLAAAWSDYRLGEYNRAQAGFEALIADAIPASDAHLQALYGLATTWNLRRPGEDTRKAQQLYADVVRLAPTSDMAAWSLLALARMKHLVPVGQEPDYPAVRKAYQEVIDRFPTHLAGQEAFIYQQATRLIDRDDADEIRGALESLQRYVEAHSDSRFLAPLWSLMARAYGLQKNKDQALACMIKACEASEADKDSPTMEFAWTYWAIATTAEFEVGDFAVARRFYRRLIEECPMDQRVHGATQALARMDQVEARLRDELPAMKAQQERDP